MRSAAAEKAGEPATDPAPPPHPPKEKSSRSEVRARGARSSAALKLPIFKSFQYVRTCLYCAVVGLKLGSPADLLQLGKNARAHASEKPRRGRSRRGAAVV